MKSFTQGKKVKCFCPLYLRRSKNCFLKNDFTTRRFERFN